MNLTRVKFTRVLTTGQPMPRVGNGSFAGGFANILRCAPGGPNDYVYLMIPPDNPAMFAIVARAIGQEDLLTDARFSTPQARFQHTEALRDILEAWTMQRDKHAAMQVLAGAGAVCGAVLDTGEVLANAHLRERGMVQDIAHPTRGSYAMLGCPVRLSDSPVEIRPAPLHGEHTAHVLTTLAGCTPEDIERLRAAGAV